MVTQYFSSLKVSPNTFQHTSTYAKMYIMFNYTCRDIVTGMVARAVVEFNCRRVALNFDTTYASLF